ncbi:F1F0-ATPase inhibitor protein [Arabidopsis thaliana]|uniref:F1F0-ATPase inhibitor protein n=1 Tax=Arabidopsis thaliana TaxID=3702 RepID=F4JXP8_ARATH|nr:F1F0-ATPase inhibitor protein [Arabidopsis thaliana]AED90780.1 F1F0-ATPase inhibitor protein [Arabidopsis thaliana]|eukprot:NP_001078528.1 F1F0-ATPase inhibitor protein [Arabidopsis thaliana]
MSSARSAITKLKLARSFGERQIGASRSVVSTRGPAIRYFSDDKGRVLSEEERAKESIKWRGRDWRRRRNSSKIS